MAMAPMDMVFTYVDGADPAHVARRAALRQRLDPGAVPDRGQFLPEREVWYRSVGEITYSVRSVLRFMPWIRTIHIVTDAQMPPIDPEWLQSGRVRIVDHRQIIPPEYLPTFDSTIIESFLHRIEGLSEVFLYNNDDMMHGSAIPPEEFVEHGAGDGVRLRLRTVPALIRAGIAKASAWSPDLLPRANTYTAGIANAFHLLRAKCAVPVRELVYPSHVTNVYRIATARRIEQVLASELDAARSRHFRCHDQLSWSTLAYSLECHWHGAQQRRYRPLVSPADEGALFLDLSRYSSPRRRAAAWREVAESQAQFICLNNIPWQEKDAFDAVMAQRGLGSPVVQAAS